MSAKQHEVQNTDNGLAVASLVLGILSLTGFSILTGIPAIIIGAIGLKNPNSRGMSIAGLVMGTISVVLAVLFLIFIVVLILISASTSSYDDTGTGDSTVPDSKMFQQQRT